MSKGVMGKAQVAHIDGEEAWNNVMEHARASGTYQYRIKTVQTQSQTQILEQVEFDGYIYQYRESKNWGNTVELFMPELKSRPMMKTRVR